MNLLTTGGDTANNMFDRSCCSGLQSCSFFSLLLLSLSFNQINPCVRLEGVLEILTGQERTFEHSAGHARETNRITKTHTVAGACVKNCTNCCDHGATSIPRSANVRSRR